MTKQPLLIEGLKPDELIALEDLETYALAGRPIVINVGKAGVLAEFTRSPTELHVEIAVVERGGEGVLPALIDTIERSARRKNIPAIEWTVLARNCAEPNPKLEKVLKRTGFEIRKDPEGPEYYWQRRSINDSLLRRNSC